MGWEQLLASVTGKINRELLLKVEYLVAENRILRDQIKGRPRFTDGQRITLATIGAKLGKTVLERIASIATPDTILRLAPEARRRQVRYVRSENTKCRSASD